MRVLGRRRRMIRGCWKLFWQRCLYRLLVRQVFLIFGLSVPVLGGVMAGQSFAMLARDVLPFLFMMLPVFLSGLRDEHAVRLIVGSVLLLGVVFALRASFEIPGLGAGEQLYYLGNMPSVLFAAIALAGVALQIFVKCFSARSIVMAGALLFLSVLCLLPVIETQQRASLGVFLLSMMVIAGLNFVCAPKRTLIFVMVCVLMAWPFLSIFNEVGEALARKTDLVGVNMRAEEWAAVWAYISTHPLSVLFGMGWGAVYASPAVADITVNYTHGLLSSLLLKTGVIGMVLGGFYVLSLLMSMLRASKSQAVLVVALSGPVLIDVFLYASFKPLDFGLVLLSASFVASRVQFYGDERAHEIASSEQLLYIRPT